MADHPEDLQPASDPAHVRACGSDSRLAPGIIPPGSHPGPGRGSSLVDAVLTRLSRVTTSGRFIPEIDGLRFIAVVAVVFAHFSSNELPAHPARSSIDELVMLAYHSGTVGVPLFFAISGFILALPFAEMHLASGRRVHLNRYYARRVLRIEPPYVINLTILLALALAAHGTARLNRIPNYFASVFYVHNYIYNAWSEINFVAWSLEVEAQFYLTAPLLALGFRIPRTGLRRGLTFLSILGLGLLAARMKETPLRIQALLLFQLHYFLVGFLLADLFVVEWRELPRRAWYWDVIATAAFACAFALRGLDSWASFLIAPAIFVAYVGTFRGPVWSRLMSWRWITTIGGMCYTIYLYHYWIFAPFDSLLHRLDPAGPAWRHLVVKTIFFTPIVFAVSSVLFLLFEKPFMYPDWPARLGRFVRRLGAGEPDLVLSPVDSDERWGHSRPGRETSE